MMPCRLSSVLVVYLYCIQPPNQPKDHQLIKQPRGFETLPNMNLKPSQNKAKFSFAIDLRLFCKLIFGCFLIVIGLGGKFISAVVACGGVGWLPC